MASCSLRSSAQKCEWLVLAHLHRCFATDLDRWQRRCDRLTQLQRRIRFAHPETLSLEGQSWTLPLKAAAPTRSPSQEELEYMVGFFDGDGCVTMNASTDHIALHINQNVDSAAVLVHFRSLLGGGIARHLPGTGSCKASLKWQISGSKMVHAAAVLSSVPSMKQAQLEIAARGRLADADHAKVNQTLKCLKRPDHVPCLQTECLWPYLAGFFDAEGSIIVEAQSVSLRLTLAQLNPYMLVRLQHFLRDNQLERWSVHRNATRCSELVCNDFEVCKQTLELLLAHGLQVKRRQAQLALALAKENHLQTREAISALGGLQGRYQRLDEAGIARAKEIERLRQRTVRTSGAELASMLQELDGLRSEHSLQKVISHCSLLRKDMRQALRLGGKVTAQGGRPF